MAIRIITLTPPRLYNKWVDGVELSVSSITVHQLQPTSKQAISSKTPRDLRLSLKKAKHHFSASPKRQTGS